MPEHITENEFENIIMVENISKCISNDEQKEIEYMLRSINIGIIFHERENEPRASIFDNIPIYINEHLVELIVTGLIAPTTYAIIIHVISRLAKSIKKLFIITGKGVKNECNASIKLKLGKADLEAIIPNNLNDEQFTQYMNMLQNTIRDLIKTQIPKVREYEHFIVEYIYETNSIKVTTITQYIKEHYTNKSHK
jgi:hypothetical protein